MPRPTDLDDDDSLLALVAAGGATAPRRALLEAAGSPAAAHAGGVATWRAVGLDAAQCAAFARPDPAVLEAARRWRGGERTATLGWHDPAYPPALRDAPSPPLALFVEGDLARLWQPAVAVVGSRGATPGGLDLAAEFAAALARAGFVVGSGLAAGIDTAAHAAALPLAGATFAVLGTGPDVAYPAANRTLQARIGAEGALVSEHPPGTAPRKEFFPSRNRILAALALGTVVIEAAERSGALITARLAAEAGREVFAVPGSVRNPMARGCHRLLREGAQLVERPDEVIAALQDRARGQLAQARQALGEAAATPPGPSPPVQAGTPAMSPDQQKLWDCLGFDPTDMDRLLARSGLTAAEASAMLLAMELDGRVASQFGRFYRVR